MNDQLEKLADEFYRLAKKKKKKPWTKFKQKHRERIWEGLGGSVTNCMEKMKEKIKEPGAFCASLKRSLPKNKVDSNMADDFKKYKRTAIAEMRPYRPGEELSDKVSVSKADKDNGSPKEGDMIARNPKNHDDQWLVAEEYFKDNFESA